MNKQSFSTFHEASSFARSKAQELRRIVKMECDGNNFVVIFDQASNHIANHSRELNHQPHTYNPNDRWERHYHQLIQEERKKEEREQKQRELEQKRIQAETEERAKRKPYLDDREKYFKSLTDKELDNIWAAREVSDMEEDEIFVLRTVVRDRKGIKPVSDVRANMNFCPRCSFPVDNCTCDRSWW